jgi:hypothetical protein
MANWMGRIALALAPTGAVLWLSLSPLQAQNTKTAPTGQKPNIVFILVDNVGWGAFGVYGGTVPTPRIDQLASQGIRFNNYNVESQCTPSRSAIMTGRYSVRSGTFTVPFPGQGEAGMAPWEYTIAELLSDAAVNARTPGGACSAWLPAAQHRPSPAASRPERGYQQQKSCGPAKNSPHFRTA